jgi:hypothetical protein
MPGTKTSSLSALIQSLGMSFFLLSVYSLEDSSARVTRVNWQIIETGSEKSSTREGETSSRNKENERKSDHHEAPNTSENTKEGGQNTPTLYPIADLPVSPVQNYFTEETYNTERPFRCSCCGLYFERQDHVDHHIHWTDLPNHPKQKH